MADLGGSPSAGHAGAAAEHLRHRIVHLSDTHFVAGGEKLYGAVDSRARLRQLVDEYLASGTSPDAVIVTGDLADRGEPGAYRDLREVMRPLENRGARIIWLMGNHDVGPVFRREILDETDSSAPLYRSHFLDGLRIVALDTSVPDSHHGELSHEQLTWLQRELERPAPDGTILAMHHPPIRLVQPAARLTALRDADSLEEAIRGSDVRLILAGHLHTSSSSLFAGIPVSVAGATSYTQDLNVLDGGLRGQDGAQSVSLLHVFEDSIVSTVSPIGRYATVGEYLAPDTVAERSGSVIRALT
jgi:Icc protein